MQTDATLRMTEGQFMSMIEKTCVGYHEEFYLNITGDSVRALAGNPGDSAGTYTDFASDFFESVEGSAEAYIDRERIVDYVSLVSDNDVGTMRFEFQSSDDGRLSNQIRVTPNEGDRFEVTVVLPSGNVFDAVPTGLPSGFTDENEFLDSNTDEPMAVRIRTFVDELSQIEEAADISDMDFYPIAVNGGNFTMDVGSENNQHVSALLDGDVEGPDVSNRYKGHYSGVVSYLSGEVSLYLDDDKPVAIVQERNDHTIRHIIGPAK